MTVLFMLSAVGYTKVSTTHIKIRFGARPENEGHKRVHMKGIKGYTGGARKGTNKGHKREHARSTKGYI